jgi:hypothetical protein
MELLILIIVIALVVYFFAKRSPKRGAPASIDKPQSKNAARNTTARQPDNLEWLETRWKLAEAQQQSASTGIFPQWYYDEATERQLDKLHELGVTMKRKKLTKGRASDLIGMHEPAGEEQLEILKFFKVPTKGLNQTKAQHEVALIFHYKHKAEAWKNRPPSEIQREFFTFFTIKPEKRISNVEASKLIAHHESELAEKEDPQLDEWEAFEKIIDELFDPEFREDYEIKKPSMSLIKKALSEIKQEGKLYRDAADEIDIVIDKLIQLKPDIRRE